YLDRTKEIWNGGFGDWYAEYSKTAKTYKRLTLRDRGTIGQDIENFIRALGENPQSKIIDVNEKLPKKSGALRISPEF
ncbi:hypothetical protein, partial [Rhizobium leguminosarum]|uniref:hypothetical protein n=1 Tax=Rhizobium leguminosarum TaxID=384 RepID=UPI0019D46691